MNRDNADILPKLAESGYPEMAARIMGVALELFARKGYAATSVREIVRLADVTNPTLYYYFENKADLFAELVEYLFGSMGEDVERAIEENDGFVERLEAIAWAHLDASRHSPQSLKFVYSVLFGPEEVHPPFDLSDRHAARVGMISAIFDEAIENGEFRPREGFDSLFLTQQFFGLLNSHLMRTLKIVEHLESDQVRQSFFDESFSREEGDKLVEFFIAGAGEVHTEES
ncbi:MAG: TetR/AcrR family transcriptional regulator [Persicimonas sp.]